MSIPTKGDEFAKLIEHLRLAQEAAAMLAHLERDTHAIISRGWLTVEDKLKGMQAIITQLATKGLQ